VNLFGFEITKKTGNTAPQEEPTTLSVFAPKQDDDGAVVISAAGQQNFGVSLYDTQGVIGRDADLITRYRTMSNHPALSLAITAIANEAIVNEPETDTVSLDLDNVDGIPDATKTKIIEEFKNILKIFNFNMNGYETFRRWYVDGRLFYHVILDPANPGNGITELRYLDPRKIQKIREVATKPMQGQMSGAQMVNQARQVAEYYIYSEKGFTKDDLSAIQNGNQNQNVVKISPDAIVHITSGIVDVDGKGVVSYLQQAIRPLNQVTMLEDSTIIYRLARAPERRIFYIDTSDMSRQRGEQYLRQTMVNMKNKVTYDSTNGQVRDQRKFMTMFEDFYLARRDGGKGTQVDTLPGGQNLGEMTDVEYFKKQLFMTLGVPVTRLEPEASYSLGHSMEISRDEVAFGKFVGRLRSRFSLLFTSALRVQLLLKKIISPDDWDKLKNSMLYQYAMDNLFEELKETEIWNGRTQLAQGLQPYVGMYISNEWMRTNVFKQTEQDQKDMDKQIAEEKDNEQYKTLEQKGMEQEQELQSQAPENNGMVDPSADDLSLAKK
jgi:hypothetical protein